MIDAVWREVIKHEASYPTATAYRENQFVSISALNGITGKLCRVSKGAVRDYRMGVDDGRKNSRIN